MHSALSVFVQHVDLLGPGRATQDRLCGAQAGLFSPAGLNSPGHRVTGERRLRLLTSVNYTRGRKGGGVTDGLK